MSAFSHYRGHIGSRPEKFYKDTIFQGTHLMVGINCLEPGQKQAVHDHSSADKFYVVMEGKGYFVVGDESGEKAAGEIIWAPAGLPHGVENKDSVRLVVLVGMAPPP